MTASLAMEADNSPGVSRQTMEEEKAILPSALATYISWQEHVYEEQQFWMGKLGDRECDFLEFTKLRPLQMKVGFAMYSHPTQCSNTHLYETDKNEHVLKICAKINELAQEIYSDGIYLNVLYVYCLIEESKGLLKKKEAEKFQNVLFKIRKGRHSREEYYIDTNLRVYDSWENFKTNNTFPKCWYALPQEGKYQPDASGKVLLEIEKSPACSLKNKLLNAVDIGGLVLGVGGVVGSFIFPPASPLLMSSLIASGASGVFSGGRCISKLTDRHSHKQSLKDKDGILLWIELSLSTLTVGMSASSIVNSIRTARAARAAAAVSEVTAGTSIGEKAAAVVTETATVAKSSHTAAAGGKTVGKTASKLTRTVSKGGKTATKIGGATNRGAKTASKLSSVTSKGHHSTSRILKGGKTASKLANRGTSASYKAAKIIKNAENVGDAVKIVKKTAKVVKIAKKAAELGDIATENIPVSAATSAITNATNVGVTASEEVSLLSNFSQFFSDIGAQGFKFIQTPSGLAVTTVGTAGFSTVTTFALKVLLQISVDYIYSNLTMKHKELLQEILNLITKIQSGSVEPLDITKFISFINFYFNTLIINHENFIDNFIWKIYETAKKWLKKEDLNNQPQINPANQEETQKDNIRAISESAQIWNSTISSNGNEIISSFISELEEAEIDWASVDFPTIEQQFLP